tara:strand:- start:26 stop:460 length:435 start_codon:yes stop_codon:yes gene_type:complete
MINISKVETKDSISCYELDLKSIKYWNKNQWKKELEKKYITAIGIFLENLIVGVCVIHKIYDEAEIRYLSIHPSYKRTGLGKKLIYQTLKECKKENIKRIFLEVSQKNQPALSFYDNLGFKTISIRKKYYKDGSDALIKKKNVK